ncbi:MAG: Kae1-associated serine/threonine protein kinase [Candidatus Altiarchaeota archaeon]|nr:Kae1-associated serine/threonine protein kinase [Candidatus Altiarchaeota archaeon]
MSSMRMASFIWEWIDLKNHERRGAEAVVKLLHDENKVVKIRPQKKYRAEELDRKIRKERTRTEARLMEKMKRFVNLPKITYVDEKNFTIEMELLDGKLVKELGETIDEVIQQVGEQVGKLHAAGVAHNDLTTSNMIWKDDEIFLIDFGLAARSKTEGFATDLKVLRECMVATHKTTEDTWQRFVEGYKSGNPEWELVLKRLEKVSSRGRYKVKGSSVK